MEGDFEILVVNAHHLKTVPGRKTDVKDSEWIADLAARMGSSKQALSPQLPSVNCVN
jgi:transposase